MRSDILVTLYDHIHLAQGTLEAVYDLGCDFLSLDKSPSPIFARKSSIVVNFLNEKTGNALEIIARISGVARNDGAWSFRLTWNPEVSEKVASFLKRS